MELLLIRHAQSAFNAKQTDELDSSITDLGVSQAEATGEYLKSLDLTGFEGVVSPFLRTLQTATILQKHTGLDFRVCGGARELLWHLHPLGMNGATVANRAKIYSDFHWPNEHWSKEKVKYKPENFPSFMQRIKLFLGTLLTGDEKFVVVSHASPIQAMHDFSTQEDLHEVKDYDSHSSYKTIIEDWAAVENCSITHIVDGECKHFAKTIHEKVTI